MGAMTRTKSGNSWTERIHKYATPHNEFVSPPLKMTIAVGWRSQEVPLLIRSAFIRHWSFPLYYMSMDCYTVFLGLLECQTAA